LLKGDFGIASTKTKRRGCIDQNGAAVGERREPVAHRKLCVGALDLQQNMAMRLRVPRQGSIHIQQRHPPEAAACDAQSIRHCSNIGLFRRNYKFESAFALKTGIGLTFSGRRA
jgi:hypothetical protein